MFGAGSFYQHTLSFFLIMNRDILLAFSGGIDSCAAVEILRRDGYTPHAMTIDMMGDEAMLQQARESATRLNIPLHVVDGVDLFRREIINNFTNEYMLGRTPAPCTRCNTVIKWELLRRTADELGIYHIATGHYFQITQHNGFHYVTRALDPRKDQSYYLWGVSQDILRRAVTPMGQQIKEVIKQQSKIKRESMGICFLAGRHYADFLCSECGEIAHGEVVDTAGEVVGMHNGIARYTIGQRRGEGIPEGLRVVGMDAPQNRVIVGVNSLLYHKRLIMDESQFVDAEEVTSSSEIKVMVRGIGLNPEGFASVTIIDESEARGITAEVNLSDAAWAAASGQPVVLYIGDRVVGGGVLRCSCP